jgi:hypothetical protein
MTLHDLAPRAALARAALAAGTLAFALSAHADAVTDWNQKVCDVAVDARLGTPPSLRTMATAQTAVYVAANAITRRFPPGPYAIEAPATASVDAAVAAANRAVFAKLGAPQLPAVDRIYQAALAAIPDGPAKAAGIDAGERAAASVLDKRGDDVVQATETYRPMTTPGKYVPTMVPVAIAWGQRKPWHMSSPSEFRPGPPPELGSALWARDYNEIKAVGGRTSTQRTAEQTEIALFWEATLPAIYHGLVRSVATRPGREITQNARLFAAVTQAQDDALIAVFDAKYHYGFWRPVTAIRNGDTDGNDATERDAGWLPLVDTPMHPEYPCAHCIIAASTGEVLKADIGNGPVGTLTTSSYLVKNASRSWTSVDAFVAEVQQARIYDGVHYRNSAEVGAAMGKQIGQRVVARFAGM